jgi:hypothetical protein
MTIIERIACTYTDNANPNPVYLIWEDVSRNTWRLNDHDESVDLVLA